MTMKRAFLWGAAGILLAAAALGAAGWYWNDRGLGRLAELLSQKTGRSVALGGIEWRIFPSPRAHGREVEVGPEPGMNQPSLLKAGSIELEASWRDLLRRPLRVGTLRLRDLRVFVPARGRQASGAAPSGGASAAVSVGLELGSGGSQEGVSGSSTVSHLEGRFRMLDGEVHFTDLVFGVPDFDLKLRGSYRFAEDAMDFAGRVQMRRAPSELVPRGLSGVIRFVDPFLRREGAGTSLPVTIRGSRSRPSFRIDLPALKERMGIAR